jgi:transcriptional regulator of arginine metabolism
MQKAERHTKILDLISAERIATQEDLAVRLESAGFYVTQASVSRDLAELGVVKQHGVYALPARPPRAAERGLLSLREAGGNLLIAKCLPGLASAVAVVVDAAKLPEIVGTIAGEDTIFIAVADADAQRAAQTKIWELF